jgi:hypothetical protein
VRRQPAAGRGFEGEVGGGENHEKEIGQGGTDAGFFLAELLLADSGADAMVPAPVERSGTYGVIDNDRQILQQLRWGARLCSRRAAPGAAPNDQRNLPALTLSSAHSRARGWAARCQRRETRRPANQPPLLKPFTKSPVPTGVYAPAIGFGLCRDSIMMQSRSPSNSDF